MQHACSLTGGGVQVSHAVCTSVDNFFGFLGDGSLLRCEASWTRKNNERGRFGEVMASSLFQAKLLKFQGLCEGFVFAARNVRALSAET